MTTSSSAWNRTVAGAPTSAGRGRLVTDAPVRMFHWLFALSFLGAWLSAESEHWRALHVTLGYAMAGLLAFRVLYGVFGPRQARLGPMLRRVGGAPAWLRATIGGRSLAGIDWRQGQNLVVVVAIVALLATVVPLTISGYATNNDWGGDALEEMHEFFGDAFLALVLAHLGAIAGISLLRRRNAALPMITGRIAGTGPDVVRRNRRWLAMLVLVGVVAFTAWEWRQAPNGLLPASAWGSVAADHDHDD